LLAPRAVQISPLSPTRFRSLLDDDEWKQFERGITEARDVLEGRVLWNVNSTAAGGGVAEMLRSLLSYTRGAGIDVRWMVITGTPEFFRVTKRIHNFMHGASGDGGPLDEEATAV
jgi:trehalose synthase